MKLGGRRFLLGCAVVAAGAFLALAVSLPFVRLTRPAILTYAPSLIGAVNALAVADQLFLAGIVLVFAIFLPLVRLLYLILLASLPSSELAGSSAQLRAIDWLGRWSVHDILALALALALILSHDTLAERCAGGAYFLAAAIATMLLAHTWLRGDATAQRMRAPALRAAYATAMHGLPFGVLLALAALTFALGLTLPAIGLTDAYAGSQSYSLAGIVAAFLTQDELLMGLAILTLAVVLPGMRLLHLLTLALSRVLPAALRNKAILAAEVLGRYATADTMILALMLLYLVASGEAQPAIQPGVYCYVASALLTMLAYAWTNLIAPSAVGPVSSLTSRLAGLAAADMADQT
jgi:paraquat-inducible protein A